MEKGNNGIRFTVAYNGEEGTMEISYREKENTIIIPSDIYLPFISVLIKAGQDFQSRKVVDLGFSRIGDDKED